MANCLFTYLDISMSHIRQQDSKWLRSIAGGEHPTLAVASDMHGFWISVPDDIEEDEHTPNAVIAVLRKARQLKCTAIRLDRDGEVYKGLFTYEWE